MSIATSNRFCSVASLSLKRVFFKSVFAYIAQTGRSSSIDTDVKLVHELADNVTSAGEASQRLIDSDINEAVKPDYKGVPSFKLREITWKSIDKSKRLLEHSFITITRLIRIHVDMMITPGNAPDTELRFWTISTPSTILTNYCAYW